MIEHQFTIHRANGATNTATNTAMTTPPHDYTNLLVGLLKQFSPSGQERKASEYLAAQMSAFGFDQAYVDDSDSAVGILGDGPNTICLLGHIDTVIGNIPVEIRDGKLWGRGAVDAKGPLATFAAAAATAGRQDGWRIVVIGATEEEATSSRGARHNAQVFSPQFCVIGEPSQWDRITLGYKGRVLLDYKYTRPLSHTAGRDRGASEHGVAFFNAVMSECAAFNEGREKVFDQVLPSLRMIRSYDDGFTETVVMRMGFRLPLDLPPDALKPKLMSLIKEDLEHTEISWIGEELAYRADRNTALVRLFNNAIRDNGAKPAFVYKTGTSDMNTVAQYWNCPMVAYGPGDSALDHTPEEHIVLEEYHKAIGVLADVLRNLPR